MARAPQSRQHPWLSELVGGPPSRHCPREPVVTLPALGAAHQPAACCAHRRASQRRRTPRQRRGKTFASVALLQPVAIQHEATGEKFRGATVPWLPSLHLCARRAAPGCCSMTYARGRRDGPSNLKNTSILHSRSHRVANSTRPGQVRCPSPDDGRIHLPTARTINARESRPAAARARAADRTSRQSSISPW